jgi:DNA-binding MarR family transcriptional regulator
MRAAKHSDPIASLRRFNRFYTRQIGVLQEGLLETDFSLTESRVLYELAHTGEATAKVLCAELGLDPGYLSRILGAFEKKGLMRKSASPADGRESLLNLTQKGRQAFATLNTSSSQKIAALLQKLSPAEQKQMIAATGTIERLLGGPRPAKLPIFYVLRSHQPATWDGWCIATDCCMHRSGATTSTSRRWWPRSSPSSSRITIPNASAAGSPKKMAKSPVGRLLVEECIRFARQAGYKKIALWTQSELQAARRVYKQAGFLLLQKTPHRSGGRIWSQKFGSWSCESHLRAA